MNPRGMPASLIESISNCGVVSPSKELVEGLHPRMLPPISHAASERCLHPLRNRVLALQRRNKVGASGRDLKHFSHCAHEEISSLRGGPAAPNFGTGQVASAIKGRVVQAVAEEVAPEVAAEARVNVLWVVVVRAAAVDDVCNLHGRFVARICLGVVLHRGGGDGGGGEGRGGDGVEGGGGDGGGGGIGDGGWIHFHSDHQGRARHLG